MATQEERNQVCGIFMENVAWLRKTCSLSKKGMAKLLHISVKTLTQIEQGEMPAEVSAEVLVRIENIFDILPSVQLGRRLGESKHE